jgi:DNA-binding transcriptional LysR family regulator
MSEINVVPYIDVMLVLLIIFMVTAPLLTQGVKVELPQAAAEAIDPADLGDRPPIVLSIDRDGRLFLNQGATPEAALADDLLQAHRAVAVADSVQRGNGITLGLLAGQDVLTVPTMQAKLEAQLRGLGVGFLPEPLARPHVKAGRLVIKPTQRPARITHVRYAWRDASGLGPGRALAWWLAQLESETTRRSLLQRRLQTLKTL